MEVGIFSNVPALIKQAVWELGLPSGHRTYVVRLIRRGEPKVGQLPRALTHPPPSALIVIILCVHLGLTTYGVE
jgi:hypothetical protein